MTYMISWGGGLGATTKQASPQEPSAPRGLLRGEADSGLRIYEARKPSQPSLQYVLRFLSTPATASNKTLYWTWKNSMEDHYVKGWILQHSQGMYVLGVNIIWGILGFTIWTTQLKNSKHADWPYVNRGPLVGKGMTHGLNWYKRLEIAVGIARALEYLHTHAVSSHS